MTPGTTPLRALFMRAARILAAAILVLATGGCLQPSCSFFTNLFGTANCSIADDNAQFSANASYEIFSGPNGDTIQLNSGWVLLSPVYAAGTGTAAYVQTAYVVAGSDTPTDSGPPLPARVDSTIVEDDGSLTASFFVIAFTTNSTLDSTTVALLSGSMLTPSMTPGCQITYYQNGVQSPSIPFSPTVQDTLNSISAAYPTVQSC
jgi:hypothetical protein